MTTITDEAVEAAARVLDPEIWGFLPSAEQSTRPSAAGLHARRETSLHYARAALTAALPFMGVTQEQGSSRDPSKHPCGEQPSPAVSATAALAKGVDDCWSVSVTFNGENILTIEQGVNYGSLSGIPNIEEFGDIVRDASLHLRSFIGSGEPSPCFLCGETERCECWSQDTQLEPPFGAPASTTPETSTEKVAATRQQEPRDEPIPTTPATVGGE